MKPDKLRIWLFDQVLKCANGDNALAAEGGQRLKNFEQCAARGWVTCYDSMYNLDYYSLTPKGRNILLNGISTHSTAPRSDKAGEI